MSHASGTDVDVDRRTATTAMPPRARNGRVDLHDPTQRAEVESVLCGLPGVLAVRLVPGFEREVDEIHALTTLERTPKLMVRDLVSLLMARFSVPVDHRVVSIVQMDDHGEGTLRPPRVVIDRVAVAQTGLSAAVTVTVRGPDGVNEGESDGAASAAGRRRATARATLDAIRQLLGDDQVVEVEGADIAEVLGREVAVCFVHFHTKDGERTVCGSALVRDDEADAVARAVLDAVNRTIEDGSHPPR